VKDARDQEAYNRALVLDQKHQGFGSNPAKPIAVVLLGPVGGSRRFPLQGEDFGDVSGAGGADVQEAWLE
jgi:hypothetical protein